MRTPPFVFRSSLGFFFALALEGDAFFATDFALAVAFLLVALVFAAVFFAADFALVVAFLAADFALAVAFVAVFFAVDFALALAGDAFFATDFALMVAFVAVFFAVDFALAVAFLPEDLAAATFFFVFWAAFANTSNFFAVPILIPALPKPSSPALLIPARVFMFEVRSFTAVALPTPGRFINFAIAFSFAPPDFLAAISSPLDGEEGW